MCSMLGRVMRSMLGRVMRSMLGRVMPRVCDVQQSKLARVLCSSVWQALHAVCRVCYHL